MERRREEKDGDQRKRAGRGAAGGTGHRRSPGACLQGGPCPRARPTGGSGPTTAYADLCRSFAVCPSILAWRRQTAGRGAHTPNIAQRFTPNSVQNDIISVVLHSVSQHNALLCYIDSRDRALGHRLLQCPGSALFPGTAPWSVRRRGPGAVESSFGLPGNSRQWPSVDSLRRSE